MVAPWATTTGPPTLGQPGGVVTLVEGSSFIVSGRGGNVFEQDPHGLFVLDTRCLSRFLLTIDGQPLEPLDVLVTEPYSATFVQRARPTFGTYDASLIVRRIRHVGDGLREDIVLHNHGLETITCLVELAIDADFANLFEVKEQRRRRLGEYAMAFEGDTFHYRIRRERMDRSVSIRFSEAPLSGPHVAVWEVTLAPQSVWQVCVEVRIAVRGTEVQPRFTCGQDILHEPQTRLQGWRARIPRIQTDDPALSSALIRAADDLGVLRMEVPEHPGRSVVAAGAPWFMTLFGRDSLLTSWMALPVDVDLAIGVVQSLAECQGIDVNPRTEEEPGRILHEVRFGEAGELALGDGSIYYGTADATPLFVMMLAELRRWGLGGDEAERLLPHADRALEWIEQFGDRDGDGYVEYQRASEHGLANQGWKDSWDSIRFADGTLAEPPIALCEVQAYTYAAFVARAHLAAEARDDAGARRWSVKARDFKTRFNRDFWLEERGWFAMGLDRDKRPIDALASNMGHCLWTGIVDEDKAAEVARRLLSDELFSGWGVRTLGTSMAAYHPVSYHNGSVWPHDNAIIAAGLMRYGFIEEAHRVILGQLAVARRGGGRLPELFCGFARTDLSSPVSYPTSCSPQAWAAASPLLHVRSMLRFEPGLSRAMIRLAPALPERIRHLRVTGVRLGGHSVNLTVDGDSVDVEGLPAGIRVIREPRPAMVELPA
jgi:glycogen debranching enzyme